MIDAAPAFRGVEPFPPLVRNRRENQTLIQERDAFAAMPCALDENEKIKPRDGHRPDFAFRFADFADIC